ncbi:hypothetical protein GCM10007160_03910 [Litchfieldella qijiaojingensis]|uniref:Phage tail protein n=1 Tax=Litchfieldella qijiaojingensis TaxID=980347 RepID=A0ABQ2YEQ9_9GAMM|nr:hypothetical protein [Halomonas qijiaojingensis]GGX79736.1 hypothetical protein GCM10007160_03910 [Halomonas qijiaojingensis]
MSTPRRPLYQQLPEIYRIKDGEQRPAHQLEAYMGILDEVMAGVRDNIEALYHDFFIETCDDWLIPYLGDLLGVSHLAGDPWTLRADVARTVFHRRRKGTLGAIESLSYTLTGWAAHAVESRERMAWNQHLNHQRPDAGGQPPLRLRTDIVSQVRGGMATLRDPAQLSFLNGPFDPFAHVADVKPGQIGVPRYNLPNLGVYLWRLKDFQVPVADPGSIEAAAVVPAQAGDAAAVVRAIVHPQGDPMTLFNTHRYRADDDPPDLSHTDAVPGPMPWARLSSDTPTGNPQAYVAVAPYTGTPGQPSAGAVGLILHVPEPLPDTAGWTFRGANLCAWEEGLRPALREREIAIDPERGRVLFGLSDLAGEATPLAEGLRISYTYGFSGPSGAHPIVRNATPSEWQNQAVVLRNVSGGGATALRDALADLGTQTQPVVVEIQDSRTYTLDIDDVVGHGTEGGAPTLTLTTSLWMRAASGQRPVIRLVNPLRFRPLDVLGAGAAEVIANLMVRLEGLYLTWDREAAGFADPNEALIQQAALNRLELDGTTLDPGGAWQLDPLSPGVRQALRPALHVANDFGFVDDPNETDAFDQQPWIVIHRSIVGRVEADDEYQLELIDSLIDAGSAEGDPAPEFAVCAASGDPLLEWGPTLQVAGMTCFGRMRVHSVDGQGSIWLHRLEAHDNQRGCVKFSFFSGDGDRLPPHHGCLFATSASISFTATWFGLPGYGQLRLRSDRRLLEQGPNNDAMGCFGYLLNTHKWKNLNIRYREFVPVGIRTILVPVT